MRFSNKDRWSLIRQFREGGEIPSYANAFSAKRTEIEEALAQKVQEEELSFQKKEVAPLNLPQIPIPDNIQKLIQQPIAQDSYIKPILPIQTIAADAIEESEKIYQQNELIKQNKIEGEYQKRASEKLNPILDYIAPPKESHLVSLSNPKNLQEHIINKGFSIGDSGVDGIIGTNTIKGLQRMLINEGYDIGQKDGYADDGILGSRTKKALQDYSKKITKPEKSSIVYESIFNDETGYLGKCKETQCSEFVQQEMSRNTRVPLKELQEKSGVHGDAWAIVNNIRKKGGKLLYDDRTKINNFDNVGKGDVVTLYTGGNSGYQENASGYAGRSDAASHTAIVDSDISVDKYGRKFVYILGNVHKSIGRNDDGSIKFEGRMFRNKLYLNKDNKVNYEGNSKWQVRQIVSPSLGGSEKIEVNPNIKITIEDKNKQNNTVVKTMVNTLNNKDIQKNIMFDLGLTEQEYYDIAHAALGIIEQESKFGEVDKVPLIPGKLELFVKEMAAMTYRGLQDLKSSIKKEDKASGETSLGYGRIKYDSNFADIERTLKKNYDISKSSLSAALDSGKNSIIATMFALGQRYNALKTNRSVPIEDALYLAIQRYNKYNIHSPYGKDKKNAIEYSKDKDLSYTNKVLQYANQFKIKDDNTVYGTQVNSMNIDSRIIEKQLKILGEI